MIHITTMNGIFRVTINLQVEFHACYITQGIFRNTQNPEWLIKRIPRKQLREIWLKM